MLYQVHLAMSGIRTHNLYLVLMATDCTGSCKSNYHGFFSKKKKNILIPNVAKKNILILVEEKKII
jgi:hypothetical protein